MKHDVLAVWTLTQRELTRFFRQRNRVIGAFGSPLVFWVLIGGGLSSSFHPPGMPASVRAVEYLYPGTLALIILFTSIFATISVIEDRREGFLQAVLVAPISRASIALGKILGGTLIALIQGVFFLLLSPLAGIHLSLISVLMAVGIIFVLAFSLTGLGLVIAWKMDSTQGFHAIMNLFLIPMWLLSGSFFPSDGAPTWLGWLMRLNPLTYGVSALRTVLYWGHSGWSGVQTSLPRSLGVSIIFAITFFVLCLWVVGQRKRSPVL